MLPPSLEKIYNIGKFLLVMTLVVYIGLLGLNQALLFRYHSELLQKPCELCARLNPAQERCIEGCFTYSYQEQSDPVFPLLNLSGGQFFPQGNSTSD